MEECCDHNIEINKTFPSHGYNYRFCTYDLCTTQSESNLDHTSFEELLRIVLTEVCDIKEWVKNLSES